MLNAFRHQRFLHFEHCMWFLAFFWDTCSTPFGINDSCTAPVFRAAGRLHNVLNAFRHQRFLHNPSRAGVSCIESCAQRLSASTIPAPSAVSRSASTTGSCAQRLSASTIPALPVRDRRECGGNVLNAFRHQRFLHLRTSISTIVRLLCAQRLSASTIPARVRARTGPGRHHVLNAFRHQRFLHA